MSELKLVNIQEFLNAIVNLLEYQKNSKLALQGLESFFQNNAETNRKEYFYARVLLLDAYLYNGHFDKAISLCQELSNSKHQTTQILAQYYLAEIFSEAKPTKQKPSLNSSKSSLTTAQETELINTGYEAITKKRYKKAIQALNIFCQAASPATKHYLLAHKWLIKAYQENGEINHAIALCQQLLINDDEATRKWARRLLFTDLFIDNIDVSVTTPNPTESKVKLQSPSKTLPEEPEPPIEKFIPKTLKEFKVFYQIIPPFISYTVFLFVRLLKIIPYIFGSILQGKNIEYKKFEAEVFRNQFTRASVVFKGLFFKAKFNKNLQTVTIVQPKFINANIHTINLAKKQIIKLEDPEFAKLFTVYGDDQIEARYVLSTSLMDKIVSFRKKTNRNVYISFVDDMIYIAIEEPVENNIFEPNLFTNMLSFAPLREYFETLNLMLGIVEDLNLDRRI
ncbi:MAG: DUF3137 domain-containing protein [Nostoc sp.]|uniref:DUF3137 domain-containing protein n=1 Tax=Nostoc sp. TaxID=1180 RepID=UPI002FFB85B0